MGRTAPPARSRNASSSTGNTNQARSPGNSTTAEKSAVKPGHENEGDDKMGLPSRLTCR